MTRRIDHLVLAVRDLDDAAAFYARLGFHVGARNHHPWGTDNHVIQFDSSFLELITVAEAASIPPHTQRSFSFGAFVRDYLSAREGLAMFVLDSGDAQADAAAFAARGIGDYRPFSFERSGRAADGSETHVAFTLAFAVDTRLPDAAFFTCQQHHPEAFWSPLLQQHSNGATNVVGVTLRVEDPADHADFLRAFTGEHAPGDGRSYHLAHGGSLQLESASATTSASAENGFTGFSVGVPDVEAISRRLTAQSIPFQDTPGGIAIAPDHSFGVRIGFEAVN